MLSSELANPVFTDIAFGVIHTYSHWQRIPCNTRSTVNGQGVGAPHLKTPCCWVKAFISTFFLRDQPKQTTKKLMAAVFSRGDPRISNYVHCL